MKNTIIGIAVLAVLAAVVMALMPEPAPVEKPLGAVASPIINSPFYSVGGLAEWKTVASLQTGTTTVCAIQAPAATSTLVGGAINLTVSSTTASTVTIAKATTAFATTTLINSGSISANAQGAVLAASSSMSALAQTNAIFAPNTYLVFGMAGGTGTFSPTGHCSAVFQQLAY